MRGNRFASVSLWRLLMVALLLIGATVACNRFNKDDEWIYAETPIPSADQRDGKPLVITVGDSIAAGWRDCRERICKGIELDWWQDAIGDQAIVLSRGIGGSTSDELLDRWSQDTKGADIVFILIGVNDVAHGEDAEHILTNLNEMHRRAIDAGILPIFMTIMPSDTTKDAGIEVVETVNETLHSYEDWWVIDLHAEMRDPDNPTTLRRSEIIHEGSAHPNLTGYAHMAVFVREWWMTHEDELLAAIED